MRGIISQRTILGNFQQQQTLPASHPLFYTNERSKYLNRLIEKTQVQSELPTNDLRRNMRIDKYLNDYNMLRSENERRQKIKQCMLKTKEFDSVFNDNQQNLRSKRREQNEARKIQEELFQKYVQNPIDYKPAEQDFGSQEEITTVLELGGKRQKELYLLDMEIGRLKAQQQIQRKVKLKLEGCNNNQLLGKLSNSLISSYLVHFDQIFTRIIDDILEEEVIYLNHLEAGYYVGSERQPPTRKEVQMAELVRALDDLCDS